MTAWMQDLRPIRPIQVVDVLPGPLLLSSPTDPRDRTSHTARWGAVPTATLEQLVAAARDGVVRGRGGAGFPLVRKLQAVATAHAARRRLGRGRPVVVVNAAEGEPASAKDSVLLAVAPHLVLDGAISAARALGTNEIHVVTSSDRPLSTQALTEALDERGGGDERGVRWVHHVAAPGYVSGQSRAVIELMSGRPGLPVTSWAPEAVEGLRGRPTLLSNAESFAHLAALLRVGPGRYAALGVEGEPGTTLLTLSHPPGADGIPQQARVVEVRHGSPVRAVLTGAELAGPVLLGGYHGSWVHPRHLRELTWATADLRRIGVGLGAGAVVALGPGGCPVAQTHRVADYLAGESAGRCGPCRNGLPALAHEVARLAQGTDTRHRIAELTGLVTGRGACAHPDGTARMVASLLTGLPDAVEAHLDGSCWCTLEVANHEPDLVDA